MRPDLFKNPVPVAGIVLFLWAVFGCLSCPALAGDGELSPETVRTQVLPQMQRQHALIDTRLGQLRSVAWKIRSGAGSMQAEVLELFGDAGKQVESAKSLMEFSMENMENYVETRENRFLVLAKFDRENAIKSFNSGMQLAGQAMNLLKGFQ